jgi:hypothetical protein
MRGFKFLPVAVIAALVWFFYFSDAGSTWLARRLTPTAEAGSVVGKVISAEGSFKRVHGGGVDLLKGPLKSPLEIHDGERLETDRGARLVLLLSSTDEIEMKELSAISLHIWNAKDPASPVYVQWLLGQLVSLKPGVKGKAYLIHEGRLYFPGQKPVDKPLALTVLRSAPLDMQLADAGAAEAPPEFEKDDAGNDEPAVNAEQKFGPEPDTLSNEYIDEMIVGRQSQLQKCWLGRLKDNPSLKGQILLQFEITRRGHVKDLRIADSNIEDDLLKKCVTSVIERLSFRPFKGQEISLSYPINFE